MKNKNFVLSIIIPCFNEKDNIIKIVKKISESPIKNKEIIIVDDCSSDGTRNILEKEIKPLVTKIIYQQINTGKGGALKEGFKHATGDYVIIQYADMEYAPNDYVKVVKPLIDGECDVCYGSRFLNTKSKGYLINFLANKFLTFLSNIFTGFHLTDMETCYKCFKREIIQSIDIQEKSFGFEPEITAKIAKQKVKIKEVPISYYPRTNKEGKKIGFKDGIRAIYCIFKYR